MFPRSFNYSSSKNRLQYIVRLNKSSIYLISIQMPAIKKKLHLYYVSCWIVDVDNACVDYFVIDLKFSNEFKEIGNLHGLMYLRIPRSFSNNEAEGYLHIEKLAVPRSCVTCWATITRLYARGIVDGLYLI